MTKRKKRNTWSKKKEGLFMETKEKFNAPIVYNMTGRTGKPVANQFIIMMPDGCIFQSYHSRICYYDIDENKLYFGTNWCYSRTTSKYLAQFLKECVPRWYDRLMSYGKRTLAGNIQQAICDGVVAFVTNW